jgi:glycosyltransferase involved in cell wall biosynthesis
VKVILYSRWPCEMPGGVERFAASLRDALRARGHVCDAISATDLGCAPETPHADVARAIAEHWQQHKSRYDIALFNKGEYAYKAHGGRTVAVFHGNARGQILATLGLLPLKSSLRSFVVGGHLQWLGGWKHARVSVSRSTSRNLTWLYGLRGTRVILNGVDTAHFAPGDKLAAREILGLPREARIYLYAARVEPLKCPWFLPIWAEHLIANEHLLIAVNIPMVVSGPATLLRDVPRERMPLLYRAADVFLMPSYFEGCSYAVIEAMSCGCLMVASPVGHAPDILKGDPVLAACVEPRRDALAFLNRARGLLDNPTLAETLRQHERQFALEHHTLDKMAGQYEALFAEILERAAK